MSKLQTRGTHNTARKHFLHDTYGVSMGTVTQMEKDAAPAKAKLRAEAKAKAEKKDRP